MGGAVPPLPQCAFMAWCSVGGSTGTTVPFIFTYLLSLPYVLHAPPISFSLSLVTSTSYPPTFHLILYPKMYIGLWVNDHSSRSVFKPIDVVTAAAAAAAAAAATTTTATTTTLCKHPYSP